jgi:hypothetical protein
MDHPSTPSFVKQLREYAPDAVTYGRLSADFTDLLRASEWLLSVAKQSSGRHLEPSELESLLIDIDVKFVQHVSFHLKSLRKDVAAVLKRFPGND